MNEHDLMIEACRALYDGGLLKKGSRLCAAYTNHLKLTLKGYQNGISDNEDELKSLSDREGVLRSRISALQNKVKITSDILESLSDK